MRKPIESLYFVKLFTEFFSPNSSNFPEVTKMETSFFQDITLTVPESPLELLLRYYLDLLKTFKNDKVIDGTIV